MVPCGFRPDSPPDAQLFVDTVRQNMATGLRCGKLTGIYWSDIDFEHLRSICAAPSWIRWWAAARMKPRRSPCRLISKRRGTSWSGTTGDSLPEFRGLGLRFEQQSCREEPQKAAAVATDRHALSHPAGDEATRHQQTGLAAYLPAHLYESLGESPGGELGKRESGAELLRHNSVKVTMDIYACCRCESTAPLGNINELLRTRTHRNES